MQGSYRYQRRKADGEIGVLYVIDAYSDGGGERFLLRLLGASGCPPMTETVCTIRDAALFHKNGSIEHPIVSLSNQPGPGFGAKRASDASRLRAVALGLQTAPLAKSLFGVVRRLRPDVVMAIGFPASLLVACVSPFLPGPQYVYRCAYAHGQRCLPFERPVMGRVLGRFAKVICVSQHVQQRFGAVFPSLQPRTQVIHNGVRIVPLDHCGRLDARSRLGIGADDFVFINVGRFAHGKGQDCVLTAFDGVRQRCPSARLVMIGDGPTADATRLRASELGLSQRVHFPGAVSDPRPWLIMSDAFVHGSMDEGFSNAIIEAMETALPIAAFDVPSIREAVGPEADKCLVRSGDTRALGQIMAHLAQSPPLTADLAAAARRRVTTLFDIRRTRELYEDLFRQLCDA